MIALKIFHFGTHSHTLSLKVSSLLCFPIPAFAEEFLQTRCQTFCGVCCRKGLQKRKRLQPQQRSHFVVCSGSPLAILHIEVLNSLYFNHINNNKNKLKLHFGTPCPPQLPTAKSQGILNIEKQASSHQLPW